MTSSDEDATKVIDDLVKFVRGRWDKLGYLETDGGAFATGHVPIVAPHAYLCRFYAGLSEDGLSEAEMECGRYLPQPYRNFLSSFNGAIIMGISLYGSTGGQNLRAAEGVGQPISIKYQNAYRAGFIPKGHFCLGAMNGAWYSQGHLYLTSIGEVELINRDHYLIAAKWPSFTDFLKQEVLRQMSRYDEAGRKNRDVPPLPGNIEDWEALGKIEADRRKKESTILYKVLGRVKSLRNK